VPETIRDIVRDNVLHAPAPDRRVSCARMKHAGAMARRDEVGGVGRVDEVGGFDGVDEAGTARAAAAKPAAARHEPTPRETAEAWESLFRAQVTVLRRLQADDVWGDLTLREYDVLFTLSSAPGRTLRIRDLGEGSLLTQPSLSRLVERLEVAGLVRRGAVHGDARGVAVTLTDPGLRVQREIGRRHVRSIHRFVGPALDPDELATLRALTDKLRAAQRRIP
jgi:DNA-binding MarR family transcriptional regulator